MTRKYVRKGQFDGLNEVPRRRRRKPPKDPRARTVWDTYRSIWKSSGGPDTAKFYGDYEKVDIEWLDFETFFEDVGPRPSMWHVLARPDKSRPLGPRNFYWVDRKYRCRDVNVEAAVYRACVKMLLGVSASEAAKVAGISRYTAYHVLHGRQYKDVMFRAKRDVGELL